MQTIYEYATKAWPIALGCSPKMKCAPRCWAKRTVHRLAWSGNEKVRATHRDLVTVNKDYGLEWTGTVKLNEAHLTDPLRWRGHHRVATGYHGDLFRLPAEQIDRVFAVMALCPQHAFLVLTKAAREMREYLTNDGNEDDESMRDRMDDAACDLGVGACHANMHPPDRWPLPSVWLGVSITDQADADERIPLLLQTPAAKRWVSIEPMVGAVDLYRYMPWTDISTPEFNTGLDWVVLGGESGPDARPMPPEWARAVRDQCAAAGVPYFHKQNGEWSPTRGEKETDFIDCPVGDGTHHRMFRVGKKAAGRLLDGREHMELPAAPEARP
jgi:protein gp37